MFLSIILCGLFFKNLSADEVFKHVCQNEHLQSETILLESLEELYFDQENISLNKDGFFYEVHSLQKNGHH